MYTVKIIGSSLVVQWLRLQAPNAGGSGLIPGQGTGSHMPQVRVHMLQLKISHAATKRSQIKQYTFFFKRNLYAKKICVVLCFYILN